MTKFVVDSSAVLALLREEDGADFVAAALVDGGIISAVNLAEVVTKLLDAEVEAEGIRGMVGELPLEIVDLSTDLAYDTGFLRNQTARWGLSLGDRACLALAQRERIPAITADQNWARVTLNVDVLLLR